MVNKAIFKRFPQLSLGILVLKNTDNRGSSQELAEMIVKESSRINSQFGLEALSENPRIGVWREAYRSFGAKPKDYNSSVESLYRRILKGEAVRHINKIVDIYNYISIKYMVPAGGEDLDKIKGDVHLTIAGESEPQVLLLGDKEEKSPHRGEVIYKDEVSAICRRFNWREADRTKFTEETKNAVLVVEGLPPVAKEEIGQILGELKELIGHYCSGVITQFMLDKDNPEAKF